MEINTGEKEIETLIQNMEPILNHGDYVFTTVSDIESIPRSITVCEMQEQEGTTIVLSKQDAERLGLQFDYIASWITLNIHSSLEAVGLTAAFSTALANQNISCNVIAGYYHDHIFIDQKDQDKAMNVLIDLSSKSKAHDLPSST